MAASSALVPIIVAVIGIVGTLTPVYIGTRTPANPDLQIITISLDETFPAENMSFTRISNRGDAAATNLTIYLSSCGFDVPFFRQRCTSEFHSITNGYSTAQMTLPQFNNTYFEPGDTLTTSLPLIEIQIANFVQGSGSIIDLISSFNNANNIFEVSAVYDQGSTNTFDGNTYQANPLIPDYATSLYSWYQVNVAPLSIFYAIFYAVFFIFLYRYIKRRRAGKRFISSVTDDIMQVRGALLHDHTNKDNFSEALKGWDEMPTNKKRKTIKDISDYLIVDDFYSELRDRNSYISNNRTEKESDLSRANTLSKLNEALLAAAENALNKVNWDKYR